MLQQPLSYSRSQSKHVAEIGCDREFHLDPKRERQYVVPMISRVRNLLKQRLSSEAYQRIFLFWWCSKFYFPRRLASVVVRRKAAVHGPASDLVDQLRRVNAFAPTAMCRIMTKFGSDKGNSWHNYTTIYSELFGRLRNRPLRIFELGLGTNNPEFAFSMGIDGRPGASLRGWRELFPSALVFGADIDREVLFTEDRIETFYCDQLDNKAIHDLWGQPQLQSGMDIIIEDGLHQFSASTSFLAGSLQQLRIGGTYVVEDIRSDDIDKWRAQLLTYSTQFPNYEFAFVELPNAFNHHDNNLLVARRKS